MPNRLIKEKSPYLLQHAFNPVDWYPWSEEAFEKAKKEDKPIFLSVGYSTCHWCHVMAHESFEDPEIARVMNDVFVPIKVDREERPDIDKVYMMVCQILTGSGGWPLTILMTPDKKPFYAGTYLPKESRFGTIGVYELSHRIKEMWTKQRDQLLISANKISDALKEESFHQPGADPGEEAIKSAYAQFSKLYDSKYGGFGNTPKFPSPHNLTFLLHYWKRYKDEKALIMVEKTLQAMRMGGIFDHIGFGFHRYSTDASWLVPHFEKMLYDQALVAIAYIEAFQATGKEEYRITAQEIFTYVLRDIVSPDGGFYSAEDADSEGEEGKYYIWSEEYINNILGADADLFKGIWNISRDGNFPEHSEEMTGERNILHLKKSLADISADLKIPEQNLREQIKVAREKLFKVRRKRVHPYKDDKVLTDWNGLMISALAKGVQAFDEPVYLEAAERAADFILTRMLKSDGSLFHRYREGEAAFAGHLDDYAFFTGGLLDLYETGFKVSYLKKALDLNAYLLGHFWDERGGGFYFTADTEKILLIRQKESYDGAIPSGNSIAMLNLLRLARLTANSDLEDKAIRLGRSFFNQINQIPSAHSQLLIAVDYALGPSKEVVIAGDLNAEDTKSMLRALRGKYIPNKVVLVRPSEPDSTEIMRLADYTRELKSIDGKATAYVCQNYTCQLPTKDIGKMLELLS